MIIGGLLLRYCDFFVNVKDNHTFLANTIVFQECLLAK